MGDSIGAINSNNSLINQNVDNAMQKAKQGNFEEILKSALNEKDDKKLKEASKELEAVFINEIFKEMRKTINKDGLVEATPGREMFESMFDQQVATEAMKGKGYGLADIIYKQLSEKIKSENK